MKNFLGSTQANGSDANQKNSVWLLQSKNETPFGLSLSKAERGHSGAKAIYFNLTEQEVVWLVAAYARADRANMAPIEIRKVV
jgi:hypothetical protein